MIRHPHAWASQCHHIMDVKAYALAYFSSHSALWRKEDHRQEPTLHSSQGQGGHSCPKDHTQSHPPTDCGSCSAVPEHPLTSLVAHWKPATTLSLISLQVLCTPLVMSVRKGPAIRAKAVDLTASSAHGPTVLLSQVAGPLLSSWRADTSPLSMSSARPSGKGHAFM